MGWIRGLSFMQYGKEMLKHRKMMQRHLSRKEALSYDPAIAVEAQTLVKNLVHPDFGGFTKAIRRFTLSSIMRLTFGHKLESDNDEYIELMDNLHVALSTCGPAGNTPIDFFPWLRHMPSWFPGTHYGNVARAQSKWIRKLYEAPVQHVQEAMKTKTFDKSFISSNLEGLDHDATGPEAVEIEDIKGATAQIFSAATDTSYITLLMFFLAMLRYPECQKRAYEEIVSVVGRDRLPTLDDRDSLPYIDCILQEIFRWHPPGPFGIPHATIEDDVYKGMFIPKGSVVIPNIGMSIDSKVYSNPFEFEPTRFLPAPEGRGEPRFPAWGFGRRICPGRYFADLNVWNAIACIVATVELVPKKDEMGNPKIPKLEFIEGLTSEPVPFECDVRPRAEAQALIAQLEAA
ncbi:hypothetical protein PQX77_006599 [Marasmius sp. AFHP31]|nr:hypothetical protein PQX77_006599 [Marasmius sp. AFHP31]